MRLSSITCLLVAGVASAQDAGELVVTEPDTVVNASAALASPAAAGSQELQVAGATFAAGTRLLVVQSQDALAPVAVEAPLDVGTANVGRFELARVSAMFGSRVTLEAPLSRAYSAPGAQVVSVPEYESLTIADGGSLTAPGWDGARGGVLALSVRGALVNHGVVSVSGRGLRGGSTTVGVTSAPDGGVCADESGAVEWYAGAGEGHALGSFSRLSRRDDWGGGGGGACVFGGGGGGSNAGAGGRGGGTPSETVLHFGHGARPVSASSLRLLMGGGGGSGHYASDYARGAASGGNGGGVLFVEAGRFEGAGLYLANGASPTPFGGGDWGYGGGGAGGMIWLRAAQSMTCGVVEARGGNGGTNTNAKAPGGGGGGGRVLLEVGTGAGAQCPADVSGGVAGVSTRSENPGPLGAEPASGSQLPWRGELRTSAPASEPLLPDGGVALRFDSTANPLAFCGVPYRYGLRLRPRILPTTARPSFALEAEPGAALPEGLSVDPETGEPTWRPRPEQAGVQRFVLVARADGQEASEHVEVFVECERPRGMGVGCGCGAAEAGGAGLLAFAVFLAARARRHRRG